MLDELLQRIEAVTAASQAPLDWWRAVRIPGPTVELQASAHSWEAGTHDVNAAIDAGATTLLLVQLEPSGALARALGAVFCRTDATAVVPVCASDLDWMGECATIRDAMPEVRERLADLPSLLRADACLAWTTAAILQAAARRTPIIASGAAVSMAALCAARLAPAAEQWVAVGLADGDPAGVLARSRLGKQAWLTSSIELGHQAHVGMLMTAAAALDEQR